MPHKLLIGFARPATPFPIYSFSESAVTQQGESASSATGGRLLRESVWVVGGRVLGIVTAISINVLLARILPPADVGVFFLLSTILTFAAILAMFGLNAGLVRFVSECIGVQDTAAARRTLKHGAVLAGASVLIGGVACWAFLLAFGNSLFGLSDLAMLAPLVAVGVVASATLQQVAERTPAITLPAENISLLREHLLRRMKQHESA